MSRLSLNQRFWIFAIVLGMGTMALAAQLVWQSVQDHQRHVRSIELLDTFHEVIAAGDRLLDEFSAAEALMGVDAGGRPDRMSALHVARQRTDAMLTVVAAETGALTATAGRVAPPTAIAATRRALERARRRTDRILATPVAARTGVSIDAATAAEDRAVAAITPLLDHVASLVILNDVGRAGGVNAPRIQSELRDVTNRQISQFIPALATGTPLTRARTREIQLTRVRTDLLGQLLRRFLLVDPGDTRLERLFVHTHARARAAAHQVMDDLVGRSERGEPYDMTTAAFVGRMTPFASSLSDIGDLTAGRARAQDEQGRDAAYRAIWSSLALAAAIIAVLAIVLVLSRRNVFLPLSRARAGIVALARGDDLPSDTDIAPHSGPEVRELFAALEELRDKEHRRVVLETERAAMHAQLRHEAATDPLTGLFNRRSAEGVGTAWANGAGDEVPQTLGVILLDVDRFKAVNDTFGHLTGDRVLKIVAARLTAAVRQADMVTRFGGEEFLILVADVSEQDLMAMAEGLRRTIEADDFSTGDGTVIPMSVSIGVAWAARGACTWPDLISAADAALYRAKMGGRNRVEMAVATLRPGPAAGAS